MCTTVLPFETLSFPDLFTISELGVYDATALSNISLHSVYAAGVEPYGDGGWERLVPYFDPNYIQFTIHNAPALTTVEFRNLSGFYGLELIGVNGLANFNISGTDVGFTTPINSSYSLTLDGCFDLSDLTFAPFVHIIGRTGCEYLIANLHSVQNLTLTDTADSYLDIGPPFMVNASFTADSLYSPPANSSALPYPIWFVSSIGHDPTLTSNSNVNLGLDDIESLKGSLVASNNTNRLFSFEKLSIIDSALSMTDNADSIVPWFPALQRAGNIHLRGHIDTYVYYRAGASWGC
jgi:hypothetical protein